MRGPQPASPVCTGPLRPVAVQAQPPASWAVRSGAESRPVVPAGHGVGGDVVLGGGGGVCGFYKGEGRTLQFQLKLQSHCSARSRQQCWPRRGARGCNLRCGLASHGRSWGLPGGVLVAGGDALGRVGTGATVWPDGRAGGI